MREIVFESVGKYANPYTEVDVFVDFFGSEGETVRRPAFWDGGNVWRVRAALPASSEKWTWRSICSEPRDTGLHNRQGAVAADTNSGLLRMSPGGRSVVRADGFPFFLAGDTAWALPWRGTPETVATYAADRQSKGFNAALLMCVQPDRDVRGPRDRSSPGGFEVGFEDLPDGHIDQISPTYFQYFDTLVAVLLEHGIVPIYQPLFQGYGWKGLHALGADVSPKEYARFCGYLVARYGAQPALWLVGADSDGLASCIEAGGREIEEWDTYHQPTGIHYSPFDTEHRNRSHQDAAWLDFQWCQTGHDGTDGNKVTEMHDHRPAKGVANGEPTYEEIGHPSNAVGWWQGHTAWSNLTWGGTMGVFYGVAALWQWKFTASEPGWPEWARDTRSWQEALSLEGSGFVGGVAKALRGFDTTDMACHPELAGGRPCVAKPGVFYCVYLPEGGEVKLSGLPTPLPCGWLNPKTGEMSEHGMACTGEYTTCALDTQPWVLLVGARAASPNSATSGRWSEASVSTGKTTLK